MMNASSSNQFTARHEVANDPARVHSIEQQLLEAMTERGYNETSAFAVRLALQEALSNAFQHGNNGEQDKLAIVTFQVNEREVIVEVEDQGNGFSPESVPDPTADENLTIPSGRGIMLMRSFMTDVQFIPPGNRVRMSYTNPGEAS